MTKGPLADVWVLDLSRYTPGYYATFLMGAMGAEVIKVERGPYGDPGRYLEQEIGGPQNRGFNLLTAGNRSICLDLNDSSDRDIAKRLIRQVDVLLHSFLPSTAEKWGIDSASCEQLNPSLVYCALSGYRQDGAHSGEAGHDINYLAEAGYFSMVANDRQMAPIGLSDLGSGTFAALGVVGALLGRERGGVGSRIDVVMADCVRSWLHEQSLQIRDRPGLVSEGRMRGTDPLYAVYETADGRKVALGAVEDKFRERVVQFFALPASFGASDVATAIKRWHSRDLAPALTDLGACANVAADLDEAFPEGEQAVLPFQMAAVSQPSGEGPRVGEHEDEVLRWLDEREHASTPFGSGSAK